MNLSFPSSRLGTFFILSLVTKFLLSNIIIFQPSSALPAGLPNMI